MLQNFNFVISCRRFLEKDCASELWYFFSLIGDEHSKCRPTNIPGIVLAKSALDPLEAIEKLTEIAEQDPYSYRFSLKIVPIQACMKSDIEEMKEAINKLKSQIGKDESFKVEIKKRYTDLTSEYLIKELADLIDNDVNLSSPDKIVRVEVVGERTGISILKPDQIFKLIKYQPNLLL